jgi:hypothetical protein
MLRGRCKQRPSTIDIRIERSLEGRCLQRPRGAALHELGFEDVFELADGLGQSEVFFG